MNAACRKDIMRRKKRVMRGSYGTIRLDPPSKSAVKYTRLIDAYDDNECDDEEFVLACNVREIVFMRQLMQRPLEGVVKCFDVQVTDDGSLVSRMEMGDGTLHDFTHRHHFSKRIEMFDDIFKQLLVGLVNLHREGVVHGDMKPNNVLCVSHVPPLFKIIDFGGMAWPGLSCRHVSLCTYVTRAPELFSDNSTPTPISDAWSLGATMYYFLVKRYVVDDSNESGDVVKYISAQFQNGDVRPRFPSGVPSRIAGVIKALMQNDPAKRLSCEEAVTEYFGFFVTDDPSQRSKMPMQCRKVDVIGNERFELTVRRMKSMIAERGEIVCLPLAIEYALQTLDGDFDAPSEPQLRDVMTASYILARAMIYDEDTRCFKLTDGIRTQMIAILRKLDFGLNISPSLFGRRLIVSIDGNIGASKSTVLKALSDLDVAIFPEPVDEWKDALQLYYSDPARWAVTLHTAILSSYARVRNMSDRVIVTERSSWSCVNVFQDMLHKDGLVNKVEHDCIAKLHAEIGIVPDVVIYLRCDVDECVRRMRKRARNCEENCTKEYMHKLHEQYERVMDSEECAHQGIQLVTVDANRDSDAIVSDVRDILLKLMYS